MRKKLFLIHSYLALFIMVPLLLITLTGTLLVFKFEIDALLMPQVASLDQHENNRIELNALIKSINQKFPEYELGSWELFDDGYEADRVYLIKKGTHLWYKIFLDPYSGVILSQPVHLNHYMTDWLLELHYTLLLNDTFKKSPLLGLWIGLITALALCVTGITGLILYKRFWLRFFTLKWDKKLMVMMHRLHRFIGIWTSPVLILVGLTGFYFNLMAYLEESKEQEEGEYVMQERLYNEKINFDHLLDNSRQEIKGFRPTYLLFPYNPKGAIVIYGEVPGMNPLASVYGSTVSYNRSDGKHIDNYDIREADFLMQLVDSFRELHFGNFAGLTSKIIWFVSGLGLLLLGITGPYMWFRRKSKYSGIK